MRTITLKFPIVVYPSEDSGMGAYTAHCLNLDVLADHDTVEGALVQLLEVIECQLDAAEEFGADPFRRAPEEYWKKLGSARELSKELVERVVKDANRRHATRGPNHAIEPQQIEARELQTA